MTSTRRAILIGIVTWVLVHLVLALLMIEDTRSVPVTLLAMGLGTALVALTIRPRRGTERFANLEAWLCAIAVPIVQWLALWPLGPGAVAHYSNWPSGALGVVLAALMIRGHRAAAVTSAAAQVAVQIALYAQAPGHSGFSPVTALLVAAPAQLWIGLAYGIRREITRNRRLLALYIDRAAAESAITSAELGARDTLHEAQSRLRAEILPLLNDVVTADDPGDPTLRARAQQLALEVRDALRARTLLSADVASAVAAARARGVTVQLHSEVSGEPANAETLRSLRALIIDALNTAKLTALSVHVSSDPLGVIVLAKLPTEHDDRILGRLQAAGWSCAATRVDDELIVRGDPHPLAHQGD